MSKLAVKFIPETPGGTLCDWLVADTEGKAWANLLKDAAHMPYKTKENFIRRGYTVVKTIGYDEDTADERGDWESHCRRDQED